MKKLSFFLMAASMVFGLSNTQAQQDIIINEISEHMSQGTKTGFEIALLDSEPKAVTDTWIRIMKKYKGKVTNSRKSIEIFADNAHIPQLSANTVDIYAIPSKTSYGTRLTVFVDLGGSFISSQNHPAEFDHFEAFLKDVAHQEQVRVVEEELEAQADILKSLNKELDVHVKDKDNYMKDIEKAKALIEQREMDIESNIKAQNTKRAQIDIQNEIIETIKQKRTKLDHRD